jgi:hypothetical protein
MFGNYLSCSCQTAKATEYHCVLEDFAALRERCPALKQILVPDTIWLDFQRVATEEINAARHVPILLVAFKYGYLRKITSSVHKYLMDNGNIKKELTKQYRDIGDIEKWILNKDILERHRKFKSYMGKPTELLCAAWIEEQGWRISNLAALGGKADIEATSPENIDCAIEVKYIGQDDNDFLDVVRAISGDDVGGAFSLDWMHKPSDFLLFKAYEAAKQTAEYYKNKYCIAFLVVSNTAWQYPVSIAVDLIWKTWSSLKFFHLFNDNPDWVKWLEEKKKERRFSNIENNLHETLGCLKELWIIREANEGIDYVLEHKILF